MYIATLIVGGRLDGRFFGLSFRQFGLSLFGDEEELVTTLIIS